MLRTRTLLTLTTKNQEEAIEAIEKALKVIKNGEYSQDLTIETLDEVKEN